MCHNLYVSSSTVLHPISRPLRAFEKKAMKVCWIKRGREKERETEIERERGDAEVRDGVQGMNYSQRLLSRTVRSMFPTPTHITLSIINCFTGMQVLRVEARTTKDRRRVDARISLHRDAAHTRYISRVSMPQIYTEGYRRSRDIDCPDSEKGSR